MRANLWGGHGPYPVDVGWLGPLPTGVPLGGASFSGALRLRGPRCGRFAVGLKLPPMQGGQLGLELGVLSFQFLHVLPHLLQQLIELVAGLPVLQVLIVRALVLGKDKFSG